ncbi:MAG: PAS domain-containing protein, partial [Candidatus Wenzhouxiangella sp. M2_3B_020]
MVAADAPGREGEDVLLAEQTRYLYGALPGILIAATLAAFLLVGIHWSLRPPVPIVAWTGMFIVVVGLRIATLIGYRRADPGPEASRRWYARFLAVTLLSALTWGAGAWVFFEVDSHNHQALLAFVVAGLGAGSVIHFGVRWQCAWLFVIPALVPYMIRFWTLEPHFSNLTAALIGLYVAVLLWMAVTAGRRTRESIRARSATARRFEMAERDRHLYRSLVESTTAIIWEGDPDTFEFSYVSPESETLLGYSPVRWTRDPTFWRDHIHPDDRDWAVEFCVRATREKRKHTFDYRMIAADGRTVWLRDIVNVVVREGEPDRLVGVMIDITELKETQRELQYVSGLQRLLVDASQTLFGADEDGIDAALSETLERIGRWCEVDRAYLIRFDEGLERFTNTHEWVAEDISPEIHNLQDVPVGMIPKLFELLLNKQRVVIQRVSELDEAWAAEKALLAGQDIRSLICLPVFSEGRPAGLIGFDSVRRTRDWGEEEAALLQVLGDLIGVVNERLDKERQLRASEALRTHAEALAGMGSWEWEIGSETFEASTEWRNVCGCGAGQLTRDQVLRLTPEPERREVLGALRETVETGADYDIEHRIVRPDTGETRWVAVHGELVEDDDGTRRLRGFLQDITDRRKSEEKLFHLAHYDGLTSLPNRVLVFDRLQQAL